MSSNKLIFFLGGHDLEMLAIRELLEEYAPGSFFDKGLSWGGQDIRLAGRYQRLPKRIDPGFGGVAG